MDEIVYTIEPANPGAHLFLVSCTVLNPDPGGQRFTLPSWIPGSYMIREFARNIVRIRAWTADGPAPLTKLDKHTWQASPATGPLTLSYEVYAWDLSVRCAHLDQSHGFFNGTQVFLRVEGKHDQPCRVHILPPAQGVSKPWRVATTLPEAPGEGGAKRYGFGWYRAMDYDELIDHPVEMGDFQLLRFEACGIEHEIAVTGQARFDGERLCADLARICTWQIRLFGEPPPMRRYLFLVMAVGEGYGGLEHRSSTALLCSRDDLPALGMGQQASDAYLGFLGLCSHEYFHTWNVKRIKPAAFVPYDLSREAHTRLLWLFEGFTSYYDDLALVRSGTIPRSAYYTLLAKPIAQVMRGSGRLKQSVAESSFDAWTKYYRQDENSPNAIVSYYTKGALVALALDLRLLADTEGRIRLDDVMKTLWQRYGQTGLGLPEDAFPALLNELSSLNLADFLDLLVFGTEDPPLSELFQSVGMRLSREAESNTPSLGVRTAAEGSNCRISHVMDDGAAQRAGLSAGDTLVAIGGLKVSANNLDKLLSRYQPGETVTIHAFRRDELLPYEVCLQAPANEKWRLDEAPEPLANGPKLRELWLG